MRITFLIKYISYFCQLQIITQKGIKLTMRIKYLLVLLLVGAIVNSCNVGVGGKFTQGLIEYNLKYLEDENKNPIISLLPETMTFQFKDNNLSQSVEGWMGIFKMGGIYNINDKTTTAFLKVLADKYIYQGESAFGYNEYPGMKIEYVDEVKEIAGFKCKRANIEIPGGEIENFSIFYTEDIKLDNANLFNPFKEVPGVLLEFQYEMFDITTCLTATKVEKIEVNDEIFEVPAGYKRVSKEEMEEVINNLM